VLPLIAITQVARKLVSPFAVKQTTSSKLFIW